MGSKKLEGFFQRIGIKVTPRQSKILIRFGLSLVLVFAASLIVIFSGHPLWQVSRECISSDANNLAVSFSSTNCHYQRNSNLPFWLIGVVLALLATAVFPLLIDSVKYFVGIIFNRKFREEEMAGSVNYLEEDEREQMITMMATRRAYMVINFVLLIGWLFSLLFGHFSVFILLFVVQVIGALSYRRQIPKS